MLAGLEMQAGNLVTWYDYHPILPGPYGIALEVLRDFREHEYYVRVRWFGEPHPTNCALSEIKVIS